MFLLHDKGSTIFPLTNLGLCLKGFPEFLTNTQIGKTGISVWILMKINLKLIKKVNTNQF